MDELFALLSAVKEGNVSEAEAITRLSRSPHWVWTAMDPVTKLLLAIEVGERTLAMAHGCIGPLFFGLTVALAVFTAPRWQGGEAPQPVARGGQ